MDERLRTIKEVFTKEQLEKMDLRDLLKLVGKANPADLKIVGSAVVRRADGSVKYDEPEKEGNYGE